MLMQINDLGWCAIFPLLCMLKNPFSEMVTDFVFDDQLSFVSMSSSHPVF